MPCMYVSWNMLEHVGTHVCSALFSHMHMKYTSVCGAKCHRWWKLIHDHHHSVVWTRKTRRRGSSPTIWGLCSNSLSIFIFRYRTLLRFPRMGPCFPLRAMHAVYWWSWCNLLLCKLCSHRSFEWVQRVQARQTYNKHGTLWAFNFISKRTDPFDIATCRPENSISKGSVQ